MDKILAAQGLRVRCLDRLSDVQAYDQARCLEALWHCNIGCVLAPWKGRFDLAAQDFLVLVSEADDDELLGILAASERSTGQEPFLLLEAAYVAPAARGHNLLQRMAATALLHVIRIDRMPAAIAACTQQEALARNLRSLQRKIGATTVFPQPETPSIDLRTAGLAQRIARTIRPGSLYSAGSALFPDHAPEYRLVVLGLDAVHETEIAADARRLYERRPARRAVAEEFVQGQSAAALAATRSPLDGRVG